MPAATNKTDLLAVFDKDLAKLRKTLDGVDEEKSSLSTPDDDTTIKGVVAHRTHWMGLFHGWYEDGVAGREVHVPAKGYKWNQLKEYNAPLYAKGNETPWMDLLSEFDAASDKLRRFIEAHDEALLYTSGTNPWTGKWTLGRFAEASGPSHFRSANTYIRKALRGAN
ncbi:ClbS/DfsB family four-helix bundle protein [Cognatiyoonia sp. IB215182]|uniref:ClbS/DfsB family four-helix bundle protein n=1 Tax=Cognatiyoonia sp. IB215182 TaxID=3097353 RepID=UPI002A16E211|nr:ClbS/DfsB family four-helix bundle protein [Cognatiyoonia sp. IB215182]MDX8355767.1 ClbS/DfsB family four-helix bundle protein [Cognatiyoonia sp. IB215182]